MRGVTVKHELAPRAREMRARGMLLREIAAELRVNQSTVSAWLTDPDGEKLRARKDSYRGVCAECGGHTSGSDGPGSAPPVCKQCLEWPPEMILAALRAWGDAHAGEPPRTTDWRNATARHPHYGTVKNRFGGWNEALLAAGYTTLHADRRAETQAEVERLVASGMTFAEVGARLNLSAATVAQRLYLRGISAKSLRSKP